MQRAKANKRRNRHRQKVKDEWQTLRMQNAQLSEQLAAMKRARLDTGESVAQLKWQAIASKELEARRQAEAQQLSVRTAIDGRAAEIAKFQEFMNEHEQTSAVESGEEHEWMPDDFKLYKNFMMEIRAAYKRTDGVLNDCGLAETIPSCTSFYKPIRRKDELRNINYFESTSAFSLPCPYPKAANAMFESMRQVHRQNPHRRLFETAENLSNTIAVKLGTIYHYEGGNPVPLSLILVMQRFVEPGRTVLIWRGLIQGYGDFTGTFLDSTGWCVLRPTSSAGVDSTDVRTCIHLMPTQIPSQKQLERNERLADPQEFADVTVRSSQRDKLELARVMQQLLLD
ncbi:hypothetical protein PHMEG_00025181 [Phytophthora megakarya]|uniref:M96 mating-specific protein n=1 Tax=Phytophthora megakarya TaxID=4795 RepID=A0A225VCA4_9STRA|nr:hypothetical protein PHMEG_00025181 [Phytophthora megakarya]